MKFAITRLVPSVVAVAAAGLLILVLASAARQKTDSPQTPARVTFSRDIAPIVFRSCAPCHHSGEAGPFPLVTYGDVKSHARQIADITSKRLMPPWLPAVEGLAFAEDSHLSEQQITLFRQWVINGMAEGDRAELPPTPKFNAGWQLGQPDLILKATAAFAVPASGSDVYSNFIFREPLQTSRFVKAIEIHPGDTRLRHHANLFVDPTPSPPP